MIPVTIGAFNGALTDQTARWCGRRAAWALIGSACCGTWCVPSAMPELLNGIRTALALSFILLVSSELIVAREGLGYLIGFLGANGSYDSMYAVVLTVAFLGFAADAAYQMLMNRMLRWRGAERRDAQEAAGDGSTGDLAGAHGVARLHAGVRPSSC